MPRAAGSALLPARTIYFVHVSFLNSAWSGIEAARKVMVYTVRLGKESRRIPWIELGPKTGTISVNRI